VEVQADIIHQEVAEEEEVPALAGRIILQLLPDNHTLWLFRLAALDLQLVMRIMVLMVVILLVVA
jgi:hypothetical protein